MANLRRKFLRQFIEVVGSLGQHHRGSPVTDSGNDVLADQAVSALIRDQRVIKVMEMHSGIGIRAVGLPKRCRTNQHIVNKRTFCRLLFGVDPVSYRPALHQDDRVVAVLPGYSGREAGDVFGLGLPGNLLKTEGG